MKKIITLFLMLVLGLSLSGCKSVDDLEEKDPGTSETGGDEEKQYEGRIGDTLETVFFDFKVVSAVETQSYGSYTAQEGYKLIDSVIYVKNTFPETLPMFNSDFQIQWGPGDYDYGFGVEALYSDETVMPDEYQLGRVEDCQYHVVFEVPEDASEYSISYLEVYEDESVGDAYFIYFEID